MSEPHDKKQLPPHGTPDARATLHPVVQMAMAGGQMDPGNLEKMLALQERWEAGEAKKAYNRDMVQVKAELPPVVAKDSQGKSNRYASLAAITAAAVPVLARHGFNVSYPTTQDGDEVWVTCRITHCQGHSEDFTLHDKPEKILARETGKAVRSSVQDLAAAVTFLRRYCLTNALGIGTADMKDIDAMRGGRDPATVDINETLKVMGGLAAKGFTREGAESKLGKPIKEWTLGDLDTLRKWATSSKPDAPAGDPEPGAGGEF